ncbi:hypothetical protein PO124_27855, partial [Bacillus licheniformis]|nr:hypothetical protein [Bacillus licheniformis]
TLFKKKEYHELAAKYFDEGVVARDKFKHGRRNLSHENYFRCSNNRCILTGILNFTTQGKLNSVLETLKLLKMRFWLNHNVIQFGP